MSNSKCLPNVSLPSGKYGMSQSPHYPGDSKEYIYVKLTDSAFCAIEEYLKNKYANRLAPDQCPKIQCNGNTGVIQFPLPHSSSDNKPNANNGSGGGGGMESGRKFGFTIDELEGNLECIQQQKQDLDVLGSLARRMRIHANDDVYDTTRSKMARAEETEKSKCIREIKPNQSDIGRKVKKPVVSSSSHHSGNNNNSSSSSNSFNSNNSRKLVSSPFNGLTSSSLTTSSSSAAAATAAAIIASRSPQPNPNMLGASGTVNGSSRSSAAATLANTFANGISQGYALSGSSPRDSTAAIVAGVATIASGNSNGRNKLLNGSSNTNSRNGNTKSGGGSGGGNANKMSDVSRRSIRERLIHLLALKPFKKPELFARLKNEGIKDRERNIICNILRDISVMPHNTYNLRRQMWNDVDENWPFFSEQELQQLKRRKPQNLTPPMSSDAGSSTSGQSPTSTHNGSPPPQMAPNMGGQQQLMNHNSGNNSLKRSIEYDERFSTVAPKKQRISHYNRETGGAAPYKSPSVPGSSSVNASSSAYRGRGAAYTPPQRQQPQLEEQNSDLSYNVLDNMDEFRSMAAAAAEQQQHRNSSSSSNSRRGSSSSASKQSGSNTDKRNSTGSNSSSSSGYETQQERNNRQQSTTTQSANSRKSSTTPPKLAASFVRQQTATTLQQQHQRSNSSSASTNNNAHDEYNSYNNNTHAASNSKKRTSSSSSSSSNGQRQRSTSNSSSVYLQQQLPAPPQHTFNHQQQQHQQQNHRETATTTTKHPSPTQQLAAAAHAYAAATEDADANATPRYDFSQYMPIRTLEVRRRYKTEFESDYEEYCKLLTSVEGVRKRFQDLSKRLEGARQNGGGDYDQIKRQIVSEYERINSDRAIHENKQRFDYLHAKLAHIKQLVMDYDKTLVNPVAAVPDAAMLAAAAEAQAAAAAAAAAAEARLAETNSNMQQQQQQQMQHHKQQMQQQHHAVETIQQQEQQQQHYNSNKNHGSNQESDSDDSSGSSDSNDDDDDDDCDDSNSNTDDDERY